MSTGAQRANLTSKMILGYQDLAQRVFDYLREGLRESIVARWNVDGVFDVKLPLVPATADAVTVDGTSLATDGIGHILDINNIYPNRQTTFENANGVTYYVGLCYAATPAGININPRDGKPNYRAWTDQIGVSGTPDDVVDNGNDTLTLVVDSVTEVGVSNAGRRVLVYMVTPAAGATAETIAIEELTVQWMGGFNRVTTVGKLGQNFISTNPADYVVVALGISVRRNTNLEFDPNHMFIGTVVGGGAGNTPLTTSITNQRLIKTFQDASQITLTAYKWLTATNVQGAFEQVVDTLDAATSTPGAARIGVYATAFSAVSPIASQPSSGIGNLVDMTFDGTSRLQNVLVQIDKILRRRQSWTLTFGGGTYESDKILDLTDATTRSGTFFLRKMASSASPYTIPLTGISKAGYYLGEESSIGDTVDDRALVTTATSVSTTPTPIVGRFERVHFHTKHNGPIVFISPTGGTNTILDDFTATAGRIALGDMTAASGLQQPFYLRNGYVKPDGNNSPLPASFAISHMASGEQFVHGAIDNVVIIGPHAAMGGGSPVAALQIDLNGSSVDTGKCAPLIIRNAIITQSAGEGMATNCVNISGGSKIVFDNCHFMGVKGCDAPLVSATNGAHVIFRNCYFYATEGQALLVQGASGHAENCVFVAPNGGETTTININPRMIWAYGTAKVPFVIKNCTVLLGDAAVRTSGADNPLISIGEWTDSYKTSCDGLFIKYISSSQLHSGLTLKLAGGNNGFSGDVYSRISIDFGSKTRNSNSLDSEGFTGFVATFLARVNRLQLNLVGAPSNPLNSDLLTIQYSEVTDVDISLSSGATGAYCWNSYIKIRGENRLTGFVMEGGGGTYRAKKGYMWIEGNNNIINSVRFEYMIPADDTSAHLYVGDGEGGGGSNIISNVMITLADTTNCPAILIDSHRNQLFQVQIKTINVCVYSPILITSGNKQNMLSNGFIDWNGTSAAAILNAGDDGMVANWVFRRATGAATAISTTGSGNVTANQLTSTV